MDSDSINLGSNPSPPVMNIGIHHKGNLLYYTNSLRERFMITKSVSLRGITFALLLFFSSVPYAYEPQNLTLVKKQLIAYHDSGAYMTDVKTVTKQAEDYLLKVVRTNDSKKKLAVVFDIDETAISNYNDSKKMNFGGTPKQIEKMVTTADKKPIIPVRDLYYLAKKNHVSIFFVTGRPEKQRGITIKILQNAGYKGWKQLYLEPNNYYYAHHKSVVPFKSSIRKAIEAQGYKIIFSIGDQASDLQGGYTQKGFKLPNPYYLIP